MTRDEKLKKIMEMSIEIVKLTKATDEEINKLYLETKLMLEVTRKKVMEMEDEENE